MDFTLNGEPVSVELREGESLLEVLREEFGLDEEDLNTNLGPLGNLL